MPRVSISAATILGGVWFRRAANLLPMLETDRARSSSAHISIFGINLAPLGPIAEGANLGSCLFMATALGDNPSRFDEKGLQEIVLFRFAS
jgi:hypothetical protein